MLALGVEKVVLCSALAHDLRGRDITLNKVATTPVGKDWLVAVATKVEVKVMSWKGGGGDSDGPRIETSLGWEIAVRWRKQQSAAGLG